jgi:hypothetical protein
MLLPPCIVRVLLALLLALAVTACPARRPGPDDPGPPTVLNPMLLDRA